MMNEVIEISDESLSRAEQDLNKKDTAEIIDISSVEVTNASQVFRRSESMYPSSPIPQTHDDLPASKDFNESIEISAPFLQDDTTSKHGNTSSILERDISIIHGTQQSTAKNNDFLDKLINDSFSNSENISNISVQVPQTDKNSNDKENDKVVSEIDLITSFSLEDHSINKQNNINSKIDNTPKQRSTNKKLNSNIQIAPPIMGHKSNGKHENDGLVILSSQKTTNDTEFQSIQNIRDQTFFPSKRLSGKTRKPIIKIRRIDGSKTKANVLDDVRLEIPSFLENSDGFDSSFDDADKSKKTKKKRRLSEPLGTQNIVLPLVKSQTVDFNDAVSNGNDNEASLAKNEFIRLSKYIINGREFSDSECKEMIAINLQDNKEAFKKVNHSLKDNEKGREQIIVEMSNALLKTFKEVNSEFSNLIKPAIIQTSDNEHLADAENKIRFLRRCDSVYDFNHDYYYPSDTKIMEEKIILYYYDSKDFFIEYSEDKKRLYKKFRNSSKKGKQTILVLCELNKFKKQLAAFEDQRYKARVNIQLNKADYRPNAVERERTQQIEDLNMSVFDVEQRISYIDREWQIKIFTTNSNMEFIQSFPNLISLVGKQRMDPAIRFMKYAHINVKSSTGKTDIAKKTLREIGRMPELKADGITSQYRSLQSLFIDFEKGQLQSDSDGKHLFTEKMEKRLYKLFTCTDPDEIIE